MQKPSTTSAADEYQAEFGVAAKLEVTRRMLMAAARGDEIQRAFFRDVLVTLIESEARQPLGYDSVVRERETVSDLLQKELRSICVRLSASADHDQSYTARLCGISATYIEALEGALTTMVREGDAGRSAALRVLRDGPPAWYDAGLGRPTGKD